MSKTPCMSCPNVGCGTYHDKCPDYQAYRKEKEKEYAERARRSELNWSMDGQYHRRTKSFGKDSRSKQR